MRPWLGCGVVAAVVVLAPAPALASEELTVEELLADPERMAGREVTIEGELVGDYGTRSDGSGWTQLNDDPYARHPTSEGGPLAGSNVGVAVSGPAEVFESLDPPGRFERRGPLVRVTGIWKYHDPVRGGESYVQVRSLEVLEPGRELEHPAASATFLGGIGLLALAGIIVVALRRRGL